MTSTPYNLLSTTSLPETIWEQWHVWMINGALVVLCFVVIIVTIVIVVKKKRVLKRGTCICGRTEEEIASTECATIVDPISPPSYEEAMRINGERRAHTMERYEVICLNNSDMPTGSLSQSARYTARF